MDEISGTLFDLFSADFLSDFFFFLPADVAVFVIGVVLILVVIAFKRIFF